jgi:NitT/TauT family transport system substrate-binding protein
MGFRNLPMRALLLLLLPLVPVASAFAEVSEIKIAKGFGLSYLQFVVMEHEKLIEKHAKAAGLDGLTADWEFVGSGTAANEALLTGNLHFVSGGPPTALILWDKTKGGINMVSAMSQMPAYLNTRNPNVRTLRDFTTADRIALSAIKTAVQAVTLQMAAEQVFGVGHHEQLDGLTVTLSNPDGMAAMLSGTEVTSHFTAPPYSTLELERPGVHKVLSSYDVLGGPSTYIVTWSSARFREENPKAFKAFVDAFSEATDIINQDKRRAAEIYRAGSQTNETFEDIMKLLDDPEIVFAMAPKNLMKYADFLHRTGVIKQQPASWKDFFFPEIQDRQGS